MARSKNQSGSGHPGGSWVPNPVIPPSGAQAYPQHGVPDGSYSTGDSSIGSEKPPLGGADLANATPGDPAAVGAGTAKYRTQVEYNGARLTSSPSMKLVDPTGYSVPTQANGRIVPNGPPGRSRSEFDQGVASSGNWGGQGPTASWPGSGGPVVKEPVGNTPGWGANA